MCDIALRQLIAIEIIYDDAVLGLKKNGLAAITDLLPQVPRGCPPKVPRALIFTDRLLRSIHQFSCSLIGSGPVAAVVDL